MVSSNVLSIVAIISTFEAETIQNYGKEEVIHVQYYVAV
jgi:hypothetical protein